MRSPQVDFLCLEEEVTSAKSAGPNSNKQLLKFLNLIMIIEHKKKTCLTDKL